MTGTETTPTDRPAAVEVRQIGFYYGDRRALNDVTFAVPNGEIFGLLGPNGGGKTTLFRILSTLTKPLTGSAAMFGVDLVDQPDRARSDLGVVFQSPSLDIHLRVEENLVHQGHLHGLTGQDLRHRIESGLDRFGLLDRRDSIVKSLSGGLRRRVEIVKALLHRPRLLLLDEPSSGLDPGARLGLWATLERLRGELGTTVLLTTHFIEEADRCDRLGLIENGELIAVGSPEVLKRGVGGDVVVARVETPRSFADAVQSVFGVEAELDGQTVRFEHPDAAQGIGLLLEKASGEVHALSVSKPTLEDVFLKETGHGLGSAS